MNEDRRGEKPCRNGERKRGGRGLMRALWEGQNKVKREGERDWRRESRDHAFSSGSSAGASSSGVCAACPAGTYSGSVGAGAQGRVDGVHGCTRGEERDWARGCVRVECRGGICLRRRGEA